MTGFFGAGNVGDEAVCRAVVEGLRKVLHNPQISIITRSSDQTASFAGITGVQTIQGFYPSLDFWRNSLRHLIAAARSDLIVVGGGGILQDVHSWTTTATHLLPACVGMLFGRMVVTVGMGVGPLNNPWLRRLVKDICCLMDRLQVRDESSRKTLIDCGVISDKVAVTADVVLSLDLSVLSNNSLVSAGNCKSNHRIGFIIREWPCLDVRGLIDVLRILLQNGYSIRLFCYEPKADSQLYQSLINQLPDKFSDNLDIYVPQNLNDAISSLRTVDALVAMRLHACIFASMLGINFLAMPYDLKVEQFIRQTGQVDCLIPLNHISPFVADKILGMVSEPPQFNALLDKLKILTHTSEINFSSVADTVRQKAYRYYYRRYIGLLWLIGLIVAGVFSTVFSAFHYLRRRTLFRSSSGSR